MGLVFSISNFFITITSLANKWMMKKIPSCGNSALLNLFQLGKDTFYHRKPSWNRVKRSISGKD